jgi:hypothetical protein
MCRPSLWVLLVVVLSSAAPVSCRSLAVVPSAQSGDIVVTPSPAGEVVSVAVGQTVAVRRPAEFSEWQVDYAATVIEPLTPRERMRTPGPDGWKFKAIASGETDITVTAVMRVDADRGAPPPAPPQFRVTVRVQ